jgi:hypothetical protein
MYSYHYSGYCDGNPTGFTSFHLTTGATYDCKSVNYLALQYEPTALYVVFGDVLDRCSSGESVIGGLSSAGLVGILMGVIVLVVIVIIVIIYVFRDKLIPSYKMEAELKKMRRGPV